MRAPSPLLLAALFGGALLTSALLPPALQAAPEPARAESTPAPAKKPGLFKRVFGGGRERPAATPTASATPAPTPRPRPARPRATPAPKPEPEEKPVPKPTAPKSTPAPKRSGRKATPALATEAKPESREQTALKHAEETGDAETIEKAKYDEVKSRADAEPKIADLRHKAENASTEEESRQSLRAYHKALYQRMRSLDGTLDQRIDRMEAAVNKQIGN